MVLGADRSAAEARRASTQRAVYLGSMQNRLRSAELDEYARARLDPFYGTVIVEDDPYAPDARFGWADGAPPTDCPLRSTHRVPRPCTLANGHDGGCLFAPARAAVQVEPAAPVAAPESEPAPESAAVPSGRPVCERCGQTFRLSGNGYAWHVANRPDCAKSRAAAA